jgi:hypothetical protein
MTYQQKSEATRAINDQMRALVEKVENLAWAQANRGHSADRQDRIDAMAAAYAALKQQRHAIWAA